MDTITAPCKINLHLEITGLRADGYHELRTLFFPVAEPHDTLEISPAESGCSLFCPGHPELESESNLVLKAWDAYARKTGFRPDISVTIHKRIPMGAGLGGGSTDAAAMLSWLNDHAGDRKLDNNALIRLATSLGADVPFFLQDGPAWAEGIGEKLTPAQVDLTGMYLVLVCPSIHVNTAWAYKAWDKANENGEVAPALTSMPSGNKNSLPVQALKVTNSFEEPVFAEHPELSEIKERLFVCGANAAAMSGSGSSMFGLFRNGEKASKAVEFFRSQDHQVHVNIY